MAKKFFECLSFFMVLTLAIFGAASAKAKAEITNIKAYDITDEYFRIEISYSGNLKTEDVTANTLGNIISISMKNTTPGRISQISGTKIENAELIKRISVREMEKGKTIVRISLEASINNDAYKISVQQGNRAEKKSARIVVDILKSELGYNQPATANDENFSASDRVVVIDAGHGGSDTGAVGAYGTTEKSVALAVALKTEKILQDQGMKVVMTRRTDIDVASPNASNVQELQARVDKIPPQADLFISIHCNAFTNPASHGMETYYHGGNNGGQRLATLLNEELAKHGGLFNRGVKAANFYVIKRANCPASLIELGFITNPDEEVLLDDDHYQNVLAGAIANAVKRFFMN